MAESLVISQFLLRLRGFGPRRGSHGLAWINGTTSGDCPSLSLATTQAGTPALKEPRPLLSRLPTQEGPFPPSVHSEVFTEHLLHAVAGLGIRSVPKTKVD